MDDLHWSWLAAPYAACAVTIAAVAVAAALVRGDRVLRLGMIAAPMTVLPWAMCHALAACTDDPALATRLIRVGEAPVGLVGPYLLLVLLAASGQLERNRWVARGGLLVGCVLLVLAWATPWTVPGVRRLPSGMFYTQVGPLTALHVSPLVICLALGGWIVRRSSPHGSERRLLRLLFAVLACCAVGTLDMLVLYGIWGSYPLAPVAAMVAAGIALFLVVRTDLLRPRGIDSGVVLELAAFAIASAIAAALATVFGGSHVALAVLASLAWVIATGCAWAVSRLRPARVVGERALEQFVARATTDVDDRELAARLAALWQETIGIATRASWKREGHELVEIGSVRRIAVDDDIAQWLVRSAEPVALADLATMRLGALRDRLEAFVSVRGSDLLVPLVDRGELVGAVEASYGRALREHERTLVAESARTAARGLVFVALARGAERERDTAREVEIADALRLQAQASGGRLHGWSVASEQRGTRATGAGWSAVELADGRLAVLVVEAKADGQEVAAALAIAAVTGAFAAALASRARVTLDDLVVAIDANELGVTRGGVPLAAFLAVLDRRGGTIEWACAGHAGARLVDGTDAAPTAPVAPMSLVARGSRAWPPAAALVVTAGSGRATSVELTIRSRGGDAVGETAS